MYRRTHDRTRIDKETDCLVNGEKHYVLLYDLSPGGCMLETSHRCMRRGDDVVVNLGDVDTARGTVVWATEHNAGVRFDVPVTDILIKFLGFEPSSLPFREMTPRDRFGRALHIGDKSAP